MILKRSLPDGSYPFFLPEVTPQELRRIAHAKRFVEHYSGDAASLRPAPSRRKRVPPAAPETTRFQVCWQNSKSSPKPKPQSSRSEQVSYDSESHHRSSPLYRFRNLHSPRTIGFRLASG